LDDLLGLFAVRELLICHHMTADNTANPTPFWPGNQPAQPAPDIPDHQMLRLIGSCGRRREQESKLTVGTGIILLAPRLLQRRRNKEFE
jgi:hypothetical protein